MPRQRTRHAVAVRSARRVCNLESSFHRVTAGTLGAREEDGAFGLEGFGVEVGPAAPRTRLPGAILLVSQRRYFAVHGVTQPRSIPLASFVFGGDDEGSVEVAQSLVSVEISRHPGEATLAWCRRSGQRRRPQFFAAQVGQFWAYSTQHINRVVQAEVSEPGHTGRRGC